jgi:hypothetical protein
LGRIRKRFYSNISTSSRVRRLGFHSRQAMNIFACRLQQKLLNLRRQNFRRMAMCCSCIASTLMKTANPSGQSRPGFSGATAARAVTPSSLAMTGGGGIDGRKGSDHLHGSMIGAKERDHFTTLSIGG